MINKDCTLFLWRSKNAARHIILMAICCIFLIFTMALILMDLILMDLNGHEIAYLSIGCLLIVLIIGSVIYKRDYPKYQYNDKVLLKVDEKGIYFDLDNKSSTSISWANICKIEYAIGCPLFVIYTKENNDLHKTKRRKSSKKQFDKIYVLNYRKLLYLGERNARRATKTMKHYLGKETVVNIAWDANKIAEYNWGFSINL